MASIPQKKENITEHHTTEKKRIEQNRKEQNRNALNTKTGTALTSALSSQMI